MQGFLDPASGDSDSKSDDFEFSPDDGLERVAPACHAALALQHVSGSENW